jgi:hypothetical protein
MFEITSDDIARLSDKDLRSLIGLLCEYEVKRRGFPSSTVTWGGHQDAKDGGVDVRVTLAPAAKIDGFVPRPSTGFQVKKPDMTPSKITAEMRPDGALRPAIRELADLSGAYVIVSGESSTTDSALKDRLRAMAEASENLPNAGGLALGFYDGARIATWVRDHAGIILWVREKIGAPIHGWRSYGAWACPSEGDSDEYLLDDKLRIQIGTEIIEGGLKPLDGIRRIRDCLNEPRSVMRLVGLSGVGKTRLVQALFDNQVGDNSVDRTLAIYTNMGHGPDPQPAAVASDLVAARERAIVIVDNCQSDLHRHLAEICRAPDSLLSLITVEYDIRDDQPEATDVVSLQPSSIELLEKLLKRRFAELSPIDARTIAEFSGGNARIAIALAETIGQKETIAGLSDEDLFKRLFHQRHEQSDALHLAAQSMSLVYSFDGEDVSDDGAAELFALGALIGKNPMEMYRSVAELERRDLIQRRGMWRAILPQAIANRLAAQALQNIPLVKIVEQLRKSDRLLKSFSRRLGCLNSSEEAQAIANSWLAVGGPLGDVANLNDLAEAMFNNVAPVAPETALVALERALLTPLDGEAAQKCERYLPLLRSLAYDAALFQRSVALILVIAESGNVNSESNRARKVLAPLFVLYLSGTHASIEQRLSVIKTLLQSEDAKKRTLGLPALRAALEAWHFGCVDDFQFGARSRNFGYWPRGVDDVKHWFRSALELAKTIGCSDGPSAEDVRTIIAEQFRGLWTQAAMYDELEGVCHAIAGKQFWREGWLAVRDTIHCDSKNLPMDTLNRLAALDELLRPKNLVQQVRSIVLGGGLYAVGPDPEDDGPEDTQKRIDRTEALARELGRATAADDQALRELLPELVRKPPEPAWSFGLGLAEAAKPREVWNAMVEQLAATDLDKRGIQALYSFLSGLRMTNPRLANDLVEDALEDETLSLYYPLLQTAVGLDKEGLGRLMRSLTLGKAPLRMYLNLGVVRSNDQASGRDLKNLLMAIAARPDGLDIAIEVLYMRLLSSKVRELDDYSEVVDAGRELLRRVRFTNARAGGDYKLEVAIKHCLAGEKGEAVVREICSNLKESISKRETLAAYHNDLLQGLFSVQPIAALDGFYSDDAEGLGPAVLIRRNPIDNVSAADLLTWCDRDPKTRYPIAASAVTSFRRSGDGLRPQWTSIALQLLDRAPDRIAVLKKFISKFSPVSWSGSHATILESNAGLLDDLDSYPDPTVVRFAAEEKVRLAKAVKIDQDSEAKYWRARDERFE